MADANSVAVVAMDYWVLADGSSVVEGWGLDPRKGAASWTHSSFEYSSTEVAWAALGTKSQAAEVAPVAAG